MTTFQCLMFVLAVMQILDWHSTYFALKDSKGHEANGLLNRLQVFLYSNGFEGRWVWLTFVKSVVCVMCLAMAVMVRDEQPTAVLALFGAVILFYAYVIYNNYKIARS